MKFKPPTMPNDSILVMGISYGRDEDEPGGDTRGRATPKVFTYALLKSGGLWYVTGSGQTPQAAGWGAVQRWLEKNNRVIEWVVVVTGAETLYQREGGAGVPIAGVREIGS